jgi:hypothetical protein
MPVVIYCQTVGGSGVASVHSSRNLDVVIVG